MLAHHYKGQLDDEVWDAILGNALETVSFRVGPKDADLLEREFSPEVTTEGLAITVPVHSVYTHQPEAKVLTL